MAVRGAFVAALVAAVALPLLGGSSGSPWEEGPGRTWSSGGLSGLAQRPLAPDGMPLTVRLTSIVSSASARVGNPWTGIVVRPLAIGRRGVIPAGTPVRGVVTGATEAGPGSRAMLELAVQDLVIGGRSRPLSAVTAPFVAGSPRALHMARIGASPGRGSDHDVVLKPRTVMVFTLDQRIALR
jgi:hypothetical protein